MARNHLHKAGLWARPILQMKYLKARSGKVQYKSQKGTKEAHHSETMSSLKMRADSPRLPQMGELVSRQGIVLKWKETKFVVDQSYNACRTFTTFHRHFMHA
mgnify:CR=1 FL=1